MSALITLDELIYTIFQTVKGLKELPESVTFYVALAQNGADVIAAHVTTDGSTLYQGDIQNTDAPIKVRFTVPVLAK